MSSTIFPLFSCYPVRYLHLYVLSLLCFLPWGSLWSPARCRCESGAVWLRWSGRSRSGCRAACGTAPRPGYLRSSAPACSPRPSSYEHAAPCAHVNTGSSVLLDRQNPHRDDITTAVLDLSTIRVTARSRSHSLDDIYFRSLVLQASSSFQLTKIMTISVSFTRPDASIGLWKTYRRSNKMKIRCYQENTPTAWQIPLPRYVIEIGQFTVCIYTRVIQDTCPLPPALSAGHPRICPRSLSAHGCNLVSSSPAGWACPSCSGLHTLQEPRNTQEQGVCFFLNLLLVQINSTASTWKTRPLLKITL